MRHLIGVPGLLVPATARADVAPDPVSVVASPVAGILLAVAAIVAGIWVMRRRKRR